jgi:hypothetical protein
MAAERSPAEFLADGRKASFERYVLQVQNMPDPLQIDVEMSPLVSPTGTVTPPLSPGVFTLSWMLTV